MISLPPDASRPPAPSLPAPRAADGPYRIGIICLGNICRSPIGEVVLRRTLQHEGLGDRVQVDSGGTGDWHVGQAMDRRASTTLRRAGYDGSTHRARQVSADWFDDHELLLAMDAANHRALRRLAPAEAAERLRMFREFDPKRIDAHALGVSDPQHGADRQALDVPDPYDGGPAEFSAVLAVVERTAAELTRRLRSLLDAASDESSSAVRS